MTAPTESDGFDVLFPKMPGETEAHRIERWRALTEKFRPKKRRRHLGEFALGLAGFLMAASIVTLAVAAAIAAVRWALS